MVEELIDKRNQKVDKVLEEVKWDNCFDFDI